MSDDPHAIPPRPPPLEPVADATAAPEKQTLAVHDDRMWNGPQYVDGLPGRPYVTSKSQYFELLNAAGLRIRNQQESATGPKTRECLPTHLSSLTLPEIVVPPMTQEEAHVHGAVTAIFKHYEIVETLWCEDCFQRNRYHGVRMQVRASRVLIECRCGHAIYTPPKGTTDLVLSHLPNIAQTSSDEIGGTIMTQTGPVARPTTLLHDMEALLIRRYLAALRARHKEPRLFHRACFDGNPLSEDLALAMALTPERLLLICACRTLYHQSSRVIHAPLQVM